MAQPLNVGMPPDLDVGPTYTLRVTAVSPSTGAPVANVNIGEVVFDVTAVGTNLDDLNQGPWVYIPGPNA